MSTGEFEGLPGAAISLLKGGVGKSTIALNIADRLAARGPTDRTHRTQTTAFHDSQPQRLVGQALPILHEGLLR